jgi:hypothetical protein
MRIQPRRSFVAIDALLETTAKQDHRAMLENFKAHLRAEISRDLEALMATMSSHPVYRAYGASSQAGSKVVYIDGRDENRVFYEKMFDQRKNVFELQIERLSVDDWGIAGDGVLRTVTPGVVLAKRMTDVDEAGHYLVSNRMAWFLPYEDGLMCGEDTYIDLASTEVIKLDPAEVVTSDEALV